MKDFTRPRGRLRSLPLPARVVYSIFLVFTLAGMAMSAWLGQQMVGLDLGRASDYYAGGARAPARVTGTEAAKGPELELPPEADQPTAQEPMPLRRLLEITHFHLFSMPVFLLILSHLYMLSRSREAAKVAWIALATLGVAGHIAAPWLARSGSTASIAFYGLTGALMTVGLLVMALVPLFEMWLPASEQPHPGSE
jgi:hypothetical protein